MTTVDPKAIEQRAIDHYGRAHQLIKATEELGELAQAIARLLTTKAYNRPMHKGLVDHLLQEVADVEVMLDQIKLLFPDGALRVHSWKIYKLARLDQRMSEEDKEHD